MIEVTHFKKTINQMLETKFGYKVYGNEVREGFDRPCFFVQVFDRTSYATKNICDRKIRIKITFHQEEPDEVELLNMAESLKKLFGMVLAIDGRKLLLKDLDYETTGEDEDILLFSFDLNFYDQMDKSEEPAYKLMRKMKVTYKESDN